MENNEECHQAQATKATGESSSGSKSYKGVMRPTSGKWSAELIDPLQNRYHLGVFSTLDEATTVYNNVASELSQKYESPSSTNARDMDLVEYLQALGVIKKP